jgi:hypothetical protein
VKTNSKFKIRNPKQYQIFNDTSSKYFENCEFEVYFEFSPPRKLVDSNYEYCYNNPLRYADQSGADVHWLGENRQDPCVILMVEERMAQRAGMFYAKSWQLDAFYHIMMMVNLLHIQIK